MSTLQCKKRWRNFISVFGGHLFIHEYPFFCKEGSYVYDCRPVAAKFGSFLLWIIAICTYNHKIAKGKTPDRLHYIYSSEIGIRVWKLGNRVGNWN
jgi:hypothetical protein